MHLSNYPHTPGLIVRPERVTMFEITPFFLQKNTICQKIYREFLARPPYQYWSIPYLRKDFYRGMALPPLPTLGTVSLST